MEAPVKHQHVRGGLHAIRICWRVKAAVCCGGRHIAIDEMSFHLKIQVASQIESRSDRLVKDMVSRQAMRQLPNQVIARVIGPQLEPFRKPVRGRQVTESRTPIEDGLQYRGRALA